MYTRRHFIKTSAELTLGGLMLPSLDLLRDTKTVGIQLYTVRKEMAEDALGTLKQLAKLGYTQIESARSDKGYYYGINPKELKKIFSDMGLTLRSGHIHLDKDWDKTVADAAETGQEYIICSSMPVEGKTQDVYKQTAERFNKAGEDAKKYNIKFGYHNHDFEFESDNGKVLYDVLMENTDPKLVHMELDLGWVVATGNDPVAYFNRYPGRFPLWHLKDMLLKEKHSTEFGKGGLDFKKLFATAKKSGLKYYFAEQEEYNFAPLESCRLNMEYLKKL